MGARVVNETTGVTMGGEELESQAGAGDLESPEQELDQVRMRRASRTGVGTPRGMLGSWGG